MLTMRPLPCRRITGRNRPGTQERSGGVGVQDRFPQLRCQPVQIGKRHRLVEGRVVDQHVETAPGCQDVLDEGSNLVGPGDIRLEGSVALAPALSSSSASSFCDPWRVRYTSATRDPWAANALQIRLPRPPVPLRLPRPHPQLQARGQCYLS